MAKSPIERNYEMGDASLIQWVRKIKALLSLFLADFTNYDAMFDAAFVTAYNTQIDTAEALPDDFVVSGQQEALTDIVEQKMEECRRKFVHIKRFVRKAFPAQPGIWDEFGFSGYLAARHSQPKMVIFFRDLSSVASSHSAQLIAVNYTQPMIDEIQTLYTEITAADSSQEIKKQTRKTSTQSRVLAYNSLYEVGLDICESGQVIYEDDPAKFNMFIVNPSGAQTVYTGGILPGETKNTVEKTFKADDEITLTNTGTADWEAGLMLNAGDVVLVGAGVTVLAGTTQTVQASALGDVTQNHFLNVTNNSGTDGSWSVTI